MWLPLYSADKTKIKGPYTSDNTPADSTQAIHFGTVPIMANDLFLEYYESDSANYTGTLELANEGHVFSAKFGEASGCQQDVGCQTLSVGWDNEVSSVALILAYNHFNTLLFTCSGNLINTTTNNTSSAIPPLYFLTAGHCLFTSGGSAYNESTWKFVFDYQNACCNGNGTDPGYGDKVLTGSTVLSHDVMTECGDAQYGTSDYALLKLNSPSTFNTIVDWSLCFAGWSVEQPDSSDTYTLIHHPKGDVMKICQGTNLVAPAHAAVCLADVSKKWDVPNFYNVDFQTSSTPTGGSPEEGSSGAGLFDGKNHLVATVTGANISNAEPCVASTDQQSAKGDTALGYFFGRFNVHFPNFRNGAGQNYLDPNGEVYDYTTNSYTGNKTSVDSWCPNANGPSLVVCPSTSSPVTTGSSDGGTTWITDCNNGLKDLNVNGLSGIPVLCTGSYYYFSGHDDLWFLLPGNVSYSESDYQNFIAGHTHCPGGMISQGCGTANGSCYYWSGGYEVDITELDFNFNATGTYYKKEYTLKSIDATCFTNYQPCNQWMWGFWKIGFNPSDLGVTLQPGHFYSFGISANGINGYTNASQVVYIEPSTYNASNTTIGDATNTWDVRDIYATTDIVFDNTTVLSNINEVAAGTYIDIQGTGATSNSNLQGGHYFIENITCNTSHREAAPNSNSTQKNNIGSATYNTQNPVKNTYIQNPVPAIKNGAPSFLIYPNPANNNIVIEFKEQVPKFNNTATVVVYNSIGSVVRNESRTIYQSQMGLEVDGLAPGMYNIIITQGNKTWQSKFVKQ